MTEERKNLSDLLARVEAATGADRELDVFVAQAIAKPTDMLNGMLFDEAIERFPTDLEGIARHWPVPAYTASLDAALALVERFKPGIDAAQLLHDALENMANGGWRDDRPIAPQICLYVLAALLRALSAAAPPCQTEGGGA